MHGEDLTPEQQVEIVTTTCQRAMAGDSACIRLMWEYLWGEPPQAVTVCGIGATGFSTLGLSAFRLLHFVL